MSNNRNDLTRIGIFYDGNFFYHVSNYYHYHHDRRARISISGLHAFIRSQVAEAEGVDPRFCQIVDAHYFRGRPRAHDAERRGLLLRERTFDDVLVREGVVTHYLPLGPEGEKGIDVWLSLEAFELAVHKRFDVSVLVACDGDFLPLVRKLNTLGTRVMLIAWDFKYMGVDSQERETRTAQTLLDEVTYPVMMHQVVDDRSRRAEPLVNGLFVTHRELRSVASPLRGAKADANPLPTPLEGVVQSLQPGYGFITPDRGGPNLFFFHASVLNMDFNDVSVGMRVAYELGTNAKGPCAIRVVVQSDAGKRTLAA